jgi:hypothetical protein
VRGDEFPQMQWPCAYEHSWPSRVHTLFGTSAYEGGHGMTGPGPIPPSGLKTPLSELEHKPLLRSGLDTYPLG